MTLSTTRSDCVKYMISCNKQKKVTKLKLTIKSTAILQNISQIIIKLLCNDSMESFTKYYGHFEPLVIFTNIIVILSHSESIK